MRSHYIKNLRMELISHEALVAIIFLHLRLSMNAPGSAQSDDTNVVFLPLYFGSLIPLKVAGP